MPAAGAMVPFTSREDVDFFLHLEMHMRQDHPPLSGRDHLAYRGSFYPVKDTVDGDLCEQFSQARVLPASQNTSMREGVPSVHAARGQQEGQAWSWTVSVCTKGWVGMHVLRQVSTAWLRQQLCVQMPLDKQRSIAEQLDRTPGEVLKKLEDLRNKLL